MKHMVFTTTLLLVLSIALGIWLGIAGAPYGTAAFTVHKLASVGFAVLMILQFIRKVRETGFTGGDMLFAVLFGAALAVLLATGAIASIKQESTTLLRIIHSAATGVASLTAALRLLGLFTG